MSTTIEFPEAMNGLLHGGPTAELIRAVFEAILAGAWSPICIGAFLGALKFHGETAEIIGAAAATLRKHMIPVEHGLAQTLDTCGTGGDGKGSLNLSSAAAIVAAAAGVKVAKHGNRAITSRAGSADLYEAWGIPLDLTPEAQATLLQEVGIAFLMAPAHHPALRHAAETRRALRIRTLFNVLGPLANPARATHQLLGVYGAQLRAPLAETLRGLGVQRAWVVCGEDGMDEVSPCGATLVTQLDHGVVTEFVVEPGDFGLDEVSPISLAGGTGKENAVAMEALLRGADHPARPALLLNAAAALVVAEALPPRIATERAAELIDSGAAWAKLIAWRDRAQALRHDAVT